MGSAPPSCLCFPGFAGTECELLTFDSPDGAAGTVNMNGVITSTTTSTTQTNGVGTPASTAANSTSPVPKKFPLDRSLCNPPCDKLNGICWQGSCACVDGFTGPTCTDRLCPDGCSYRGRCNRRTGECECYKPYIGKTCAGQSEEVIPRPVDGKHDVYGLVPDYEPTEFSQNTLFKTKKGLSDGVHMIEQNSQMQFQQGMQDVVDYLP